MPRRRTLLFIALAVGLVGLAGCSNGADPDAAVRPRTGPPRSAPVWTVPPPPDEPASADQAFVTAADRACELAISKLASPPAPVEGPPFEQHLARVELALDALEDDLGALEPPASGVEDHAKLVGTVAEEVTAVRQARAAASAGDVAERDRQLEVADALETHFGDRARDLALQECSRLASTNVA